MASFSPVPTVPAREEEASCAVSVTGKKCRWVPSHRVYVAAVAIVALVACAALTMVVRKPPRMTQTGPAVLANKEVVELTAAAQMVAGVLLNQPVAKLMRKVDTSQQLRAGSCALNVVQASNYLARAGLMIDQATKTCTAPRLTGYSSLYKKQACAANAVGVFSSVGWVATFLSLAASECSRNVNLNALCAATIEGLISALAGIAVEANIAAANCLKGAENRTAANTETDAIWQSVQRRRLNDVDGKFPPDRNAEMATCVLDATEAATSLAQMGLNIQAARRACIVFDRTRDVPLVGVQTQKICTMDIGQVLFFAGQAATFIAAAVAHCAEGINIEANCAAGVSGLLSTAMGAVFLFSAMDLGPCGELKKLGPLKNPVVKLFGQGIARRLGENETGEEVA